LSSFRGGAFFFFGFCFPVDGSRRLNGVGRCQPLTQSAGTTDAIQAEDTDERKTE